MVRAVIDRVFERRLAALVNSREHGALPGGRRGLERETLRVTPRGRVSARPHPEALGSALANPHVTTDYSEALLELVTPTFRDHAALAHYLFELHAWVQRHLEDELLWASSMPCEIAGEDEVPIARYGRSHRGRFKEIYRRGLQTRYGGTMQAIAGAHFNYSFADALWPVWADIEGQADSAALRSAAYFALVRNYRRLGWLPLYLFGASPALSNSLVRARDDATLQPLGSRTLYLPHATSLRMSDLGYRNQGGVSVSVNSLEQYVRDLRHATHTVHPPFAALGVLVGGDYRQLNDCLLQIDNEYYSSIRPKRTPRTGELTSVALRRDGVEYVEVRALDLCPFEPTGICPDELHFMEAFLGLCLLRDGAAIESAGLEEADRNQLAVARRGREPGLQLERDGRRLPLAGWAAELLDGMEGVCELLDRGDPATPYSRALARQADKLRDPALTPSARLLQGLREADGDFPAFTLGLSAGHATTLAAQEGRDATLQAAFAEEAQESLREQSRIEAADQGSFAQYLAQVLGPEIA
jgi:glutamate--cysteine ligase